MLSPINSLPTSSIRTCNDHISNVSDFSIIVPFYNTDSTQLKKCLESLTKLNQQLLKEIVLIDDGSCLMSKSLLQEVLNEIRNKQFCNKIRLITNEDNLGLAAARKIGFQNASGKYILFVDSDDYINSVNALDKLLAIFKLFPSSSFIKSGYTRVERGLQAKIPTNHFEPYEEDFDSDGVLRSFGSLKDQQIAVGLYAFRRESILDPKLWLTIKEAYEDHYFTACLLGFGLKGVVSSETYYSYRAENRGSIMGKMRQNGTIEWVKSVQKGLNSFSNNNLKNNSALENMGLLTCVRSVINCGYRYCAKKIENFPEKEKLAAVNEKYKLYSGALGKYFYKMLNSGFLGGIMPKVINIFRPLIRLHRMRKGAR